MIKNNFIIMSFKNYTSLSKLAISNDINACDSYSNNEIALKFDKSIEASFIDNDVFLIKSNDIEIRIDIDIEFIEKSIKIFRSKDHV